MLGKVVMGVKEFVNVYIDLMFVDKYTVKNYH